MLRNISSYLLLEVFSHQLQNLRKGLSPATELPLLAERHVIDAEKKSLHEADILHCFERGDWLGEDAGGPLENAFLLFHHKSYGQASKGFNCS